MGSQQINRSWRSAIIPQSAFCLLLSAFLLLALAQLTSTSPTFDEGFTLLRGYAAWRTGHLVPIGHPPLAHWLSGLGVLLEPNLPDPRALEGWYGDKYDETSRDLLWNRGLNADRIIFLGRFPILLLGVVLGAATIRWANDLLGWSGGLGAAVFHALSPNLLAHSAIATTDLPVAAFYVFTLYRWHRFSQRPSLTNAALTGLMLGLALASKFSALLLLPTLIILGVAYGVGKTQHAASTIRHSAFIILPSAFIVLWANYGFAINPYPLAQFFRELSELQSLASEGHTAYLFGLLSTKGWWYYHPIVFLVKTPLPLLLLIGYGLWQMAHATVRFVTRSAPTSNFQLPTSNLRPLTPNPELLIPLLSSSIYLLAATLSSLNVGYRYLLPALPLLHILAASVAQQATRSKNYVSRLTIYLLFVWHAVSTLLIAPHFLAYFNEIVNPSNGYKILADSNLDWGQDLPALARYLAGRRVHLSYFGQADPAYYGIDYDPLPAWPPPPESHFAPADPAPGLYSISASNLVGVQLADPNTFAYFRALEPLTVINYSIFIYEIPDHDPVGAFAQCTPPLLDRASVNWLFDGRNLRQLTFDCKNSFLIPGDPGIVLYPESATSIVDLGDPVFDWTRSDGTIYYRLYRSRPSNYPTIQPPIAQGRYLTLLAYDLTPQALTLTWMVTEPAPPPVSVFVHFNWPDGTLAEAYDALGVPAEYWQAGDVIIQGHPISPDLPPGDYGIVVGLYSLADGTRYSEINLTIYKK